MSLPHGAMGWSEVSDYRWCFLAIYSCCVLMQKIIFSSSKYFSSCQLKGGPSSVHFKVALIRLQGKV